ncbi:MAG: penicillin-binding protein, partial [Chloroflexota bacterium]|nr:penicillin-binding protein [Chloroflexota bacterium]
MSNPPTRSNRSPSPSSTKRKPVRKGWRRFFSIKRILLTMLGLFLLAVAAFGVAYAVIDIPQPNELANAQASIVYYADGKTEMARISEDGGNRESVPLSKIPVHVQRALLAAEDRTFYENNGVSPSGIGRSVLVALKGGSAQGGSTITQQYVKNYFLTQDRTVSRKAREFIISIKIDKQESKETILENYLNTIYYGRGAFGIQTAAKAYFGHDASKLTVAEGALLASVIRGPEFYDPAKGAEQKANALARVDYVLDGMVSQGWLSPQERAKTTFPKTIARARITKAGTVGYLTDEVRNELKAKLGLTATDIDRGGLRIVTTIDKKAQDSAVKAVDDNMPSEKDAPKLNVGLTAIKPGDGAIVAMYGGKDFSKTQLNTSTGATMQGGSTFKVFGLLAAGQKEISTKTKFDGRSHQSFPEFNKPVDNFGPGQGTDYGRIDLRTATAKSVNTVFAQLNIKLADGSGQATGVRDAAILAGLPKNTPGLDANMANILGTASPHVIDMANAYATIAAQGQRATPYLITEVTSSGGGIDYKVEKALTPAFDQKVTADVTDAMTSVVSKGGTAERAGGLGRPAAGKTGTTDENRAAWFAGFTPQLAAAVGMYQGKGEDPIKVTGMREFTGGGVPVDIWTAFMKGALQGEKVMDFPKRAGLGDDTPPTATAAPETSAPRTSAPTARPTTAAPTT